ncbi:MAG: hypothetical protein H6816_01480 [Phycisphaerales bacterium]|nr:hypothetical protein [Phycisphaerales bacterium]
MFFERSGPVWETLRGLEARLDLANIQYVIIGGLALNAYRYARQTIDVDVVVTSEGFDVFRRSLAGEDYVPATGAPRRFRDARTDVTVDFLIAGELAGHRGKNRKIQFPDPGDAQLQMDLRTVTLPRLIELKLVTWRYKDWGDVVELIRINQLDESFADQLDSLVRSAFLQCYDQANDPGYDAG